MIYLISNTAFDDKSVRQLELCRVKFNTFSVDLSTFDALIITSKNSINSLKFNSIAVADILVFAIGKASALACREFGFSMVYQAQNSHGSEFGAEIIEKLRDKKVLFIKARETVSNLDIFFSQNGIDITTIVGYENEILQNVNAPRPESGSIIIFTSPLNVRAFLQNFGWDSSYQAIAIGKATAKALALHTSPIISDTQSLKNCVEIAKSLRSVAN